MSHDYKRVPPKMLDEILKTVMNIDPDYTLSNLANLSCTVLLYNDYLNRKDSDPQHKFTRLDAEVKLASLMADVINSVEATIAQNMKKDELN